MPTYQNGQLFSGAVTSTPLGPFADRDGPGVTNLSLAETNQTLVVVDSSVAEQTVNLPAATSAQTGNVVTLKRIGANLVYVVADATNDIDGSLASVAIPDNLRSVTLFCNGSTWYRS